MTDDIPLHKIADKTVRRILACAFLLIIVFYGYQRQTEYHRRIGFTILSEIILDNWISGNTIKAPSIPYVPRIEVLGSLTSKVIICESSGNPRAINKKSGAKGLLQIIPSSQRFCEKGLGLKLDMFNPDDNLLCGGYLYQHGKLSHWKSSWHCWGK